MISYEPFWRYIQEHKISTYQLIGYGITPDSIQRLRSGKNISTRTFDRLCAELDCNVSDIMVYIPDSR